MGGAPLGALLLGAALLFSFFQLRKAPTEQAALWERRGLPVLASVVVASLSRHCRWLSARLRRQVVVPEGASAGKRHTRRFEPPLSRNRVSKGEHAVGGW